MATRKFEQIASEIRSRVLSLRYGLEGGLPETRELATVFDCSINTVSTALVLLESQRLVVRRGHTFYVNPQYVVPMSDYLPLVTRRVPLGSGYYRNVGRVEVRVPPDNFQIKLNLHPQDTAVFRMQISGEIVDGTERPLQLTYRYHFCDLSIEQVAHMDDPLYHPLLHENEYAVTLHCVDEITPRMITSQEQELLALPANTPVIYLFETWYSSNRDKLLMAQEVILPPNETLVFSFSFENYPPDKKGNSHE